MSAPTEKLLASVGRSELTGESDGALNRRSAQEQHARDFRCLAVQMPREATTNSQAGSEDSSRADDRHLTVAPAHAFDQRRGEIGQIVPGFVAQFLGNPIAVARRLEHKRKKGCNLLRLERARDHASDIRKAESLADLFEQLGVGPPPIVIV